MGFLRHVVRGGSGIGPEGAFELIRAGDGVLVDVRELSEWKTGHAPGARHMPLGELGRRLQGLPRDRRLVVVCRSGHRSATATATLMRSGFDAVNLEGGMRAWAAAGLPVEDADHEAGKVE